jgi:uncharacterized membrane protein
VAFGDPLQWVIIGIIAIIVVVVVIGGLFYLLGKARGQVKGMKDAAQMPKQPSQSYRV